MRPIAKLCVLALCSAAGCGGHSGVVSYTISGTISTPAKVLNGSPAPLAGVLVHLGGKDLGVGKSDIAVTGPSGEYSFSQLAPGGYTVTPSSLVTFDPQVLEVVIDGADAAGQDFVAEDPTLKFISGTIEGAARMGVAVQIQGPISATAITDISGNFRVGPLPAGNYTVTPSVAPLASYPPQANLTLENQQNIANFLIAPPASAASVVVAGDATSGVGSHSFQSVVSDDPGVNDGPEPSIVIYSPVDDRWTYAMYFNPSGVNLPNGFGGDVSFPGHPTVATFTQAEENHAAIFNSFEECWPSNDGGGWFQHDYTLTLTSVGEGVPSNVSVGNGGVNVIDYPVHGSLHINCTGVTKSTAPPPQGTVTVDVTF
jgi:hypothetical protein